jgi:hypothetical protein
LDEVEELLKKHGGSEYSTAKSYWLAHARIALTDEHEFLSDSDNMSKTLRKLS